MDLCFTFVLQNICLHCKDVFLTKAPSDHFDKEINVHELERSEQVELELSVRERSLRKRETEMPVRCKTSQTYGIEER